MKWSNVSGAGSLSVGSGVGRTSFSFHSLSVGFKPTPRHGCTWLTCCCCWRWWQSRQVEFRAHFLFRNGQQVGLQLMPLDTQVVVYLPSIDNTEERFTGRSYNIFGCSMVIKELHHRRPTQSWVRLQFPKWHTFTFAINCRSSVTTSSRMHEWQAVDHSSRRTPQGCTAVYLVRMAFASRQEYLYILAQLPATSNTVKQSTYRSASADAYDAPHNQQLPDAMWVGHWSAHCSQCSPNNSCWDMDTCMLSSMITSLDDATRRYWSASFVLGASYPTNTTRTHPYRFVVYCLYCYCWMLPNNTMLKMTTVNSVYCCRWWLAAAGCQVI